MQHNDSPYPGDWLEIAEKDLKRLHRALRAQYPDQAGFYLQQTVEKFLKAFLLSRGATLRRIHILDILLAEAIPHEPTFIQYQLVCQKITAFYMLDRYPILADAGTTEQIVRECHRDVRGLMKQIRAALQPIMP
jgi:HEPN domain-containing protein